MIAGKVNPRGEARISLRVCDPIGSSREINAIVDTGFTGSITLSPDLIAELGLEWIGSNDGIEFDVYAATVVWDGDLKKVEVNASRADALIGMRLLQGCTLEVEVFEGGDVSIRPLHDSPGRSRPR